MFLRRRSDARLASLSAEGDGRAFAAIVRRHRRAVRRICRRVLPEPLAEAAVHQTFLKARMELESATDVKDVGAWLCRLARDIALDTATQAAYDYDELVLALQFAPASEEDLERRAVIRETLTSVAALSAKRQEALLRTTVERAAEPRGPTPGSFPRPRDSGG